MSVTSKAIRDFNHWMKTCKDLGWHKSTYPMLADFWWQWHDDEGRLLSEPRPSPSALPSQEK